jgi:exonuclease SbcC
MLHLKHLRMEGFRGFPTKSNVVEFTTPAVLIYGDNHQGKSSLLNAIEWCLYGDQCIGTKSGIRERVGGWEVVSRSAPKATVELAIETDEGVVTIKRGEVKGKGKRGKIIEITSPDGSVKKGDEAEQEIVRLVGLSFRDFATTVHQHQETIRDIVIQKPKDRNDAIDRLLGLSDYRNVLEGIRKSRITDIEKGLHRQRDELAARIEQALSLRQNDLEQKKEEAVSSGLNENELNENKLLEGANNVGRQIAEFASELGVTATPISAPSDWRGFPSFGDEAKKELERLWSESPDVKEQSQLTKSRTEADSLKAEYSKCNQDAVTAERELDTFEQEHGNQDQIDADIQGIQESISAVDTEIGQVSPKAKLVEEGIAILESAAPDESTDLCPLCGEEVPDLLSHLKKKWTEEIESQVQDLQVRRNDLRKKEGELKRLKDKLANLTDQVKGAKNRLEGSTQKVAEFLDRELTDQDDPTALLNAEMERANSRLEAIESAIKDKRDTLNRISDSLEQLNLLYDVLAFEEKIGDIERITETDEYRELEEILDKVAELMVDVELLEKLVRKCIREEAESRMIDAKKAIDDYFQRIVGNPGIRKLNVEIEEDKRTGGNSYRFCDENGQELNPVLSQGDLNGLALSMFLGLVEACSHPVGFVLMDDPSQSLGTLQKKRLVEVLDAVCQSSRSIVVATMDTEVREYLETNLTKAKTIYEVSNWKPESGPEVSKQV